MKKRPFESFSIYYGNNTLMKVSYSIIEFFTIFKLRNFENYEMASEKDIENYYKMLENMLYKMGTYDNKKNGTKGVIYKIYSYYKKRTKYQDILIESDKKMKVESALYNFKLSEKENFKNMKTKSLINKIINESYYDKEDYILIRSIFPYNHTPFYKKGTNGFGDVIKKMDEEEYKNYSSLFLSLKDIHVTKYENLNSSNEKMLQIEKIYNSNEFENIFIKIGLGEKVSNIKDVNFFYNNMNVINKKINKEVYYIYKNEKDIEPDILEVDLNGVVYKKINNNDIILITENNEKPYIEYNDRLEKLIVYFKNENIKKSKLEIDCRFYEKGMGEKITVNYILKETPEDISFNISEKISDVLKEIRIDEFFTVTEIMKLDPKTLQKNLKTSRLALGVLTQLPAFNGKIYDKELAIKKQSAISSMVYWINEGKQFNSVRFGIGIKNYYESPIQRSRINESLKRFGIEFLRVEDEFNNVLNVNSNVEYENCKSLIMNIENEELMNFLHLKYGDKLYSGKSFDNYNDILSMKINTLYLKRKDTIESVNFFEGPDVFNVSIAAKSGAGKSFFATNAVSNFLDKDENNRVTIIDSGGSYNKMTEVEGGTNILVSPSDSKNCLNPFQYRNYIVRLQIILILMKKYKNNDISENEKEMLYTLSNLPLKEDVSKDEIILDSDGFPTKTTFKETKPQELFKLSISSLKQLYLERNIETKSFRDIMEKLAINAFNNVLLKKYKDTVYPNLKKINKNDISYEECNKFIFNEELELMYIIIEDIQNEMLFLLKEETQLTDIEINTLSNYIYYLDLYIDEDKYGLLFNGKPSLNLEGKLNNIDLGEDTDDNLLSILVSALTMSFFNQMTNPKYKSSKKTLLVDEAHKIFNSKDKSGVESLAYLSRTVRKHGAQIIVITQNVEDYDKDIVRTIWNQSGWKIFLKRQEEVSVNVSGLPENFKKYLSTNDTFRFILQSEMKYGLVESIFSDIDYAIATTNKDEKNIQEILKSLFNNDLKKTMVMFAKIFGFNSNESKSLKDLRNNIGAGSSLIITESLFKEFSKFLDSDFEKKIFIKFYSKMLHKLDSLFEKKEEKIEEINLFLSIIKNKDLIKDYLNLFFNENL